MWFRLLYLALWRQGRAGLGLWVITGLRMWAESFSPLTPAGTHTHIRPCDHNTQAYKPPTDPAVRFHQCCDDLSTLIYTTGKMTIFPSWKKLEMEIQR